MSKLEKQDGEAIPIGGDWCIHNEDTWNLTLDSDELISMLNMINSAKLPEKRVFYPLKQEIEKQLKI